MAKTETPELERTYNVPLRKEYRKVPKWKRTKKAVKALKQFLGKHMKSDDVKLGTKLNEEMWKHGIRNPPHHVKVNVTKDKEGVVKAELFGAKAAKEEKKASKKEEKAKPAAEKETKAPVKEEASVSEPSKEGKEETPVKEEKVAETPKAEEKPVEAKETAPAEKVEEKKE